MSRAGYLALTVVAVFGLGTISILSFAPTFVWNASASVPIGLYRITPAGRLDSSDLVAVRPPEPVAAFMMTRGYIARDIPILKHVVALPGQRVCRHDHAITVDGIPCAEARARDSRGRDLPVWQGCRRIAEGEIFLMNPEVGDSLDGRYFGPFPASRVIGRAIPIFTDSGGNGRFAWGAPLR